MRTCRQATFSRRRTPSDPEMVELLDWIDRRFGRVSIGFATTGCQEKPEWGMRQQQFSNSFTTRLSDIPQVLG